MGGFADPDLMAVLAALVFALTLPPPNGTHQARCGTAVEHRAFVQGAALANSVARGLAKVRLTLASFHRREPWLTVVYVEADLRTAQRLFAATGRNLRQRAKAEARRPRCGGS
jgi:hypothetical protein